MSATLGTFVTCLDTFHHATDLLATHRACFANFSTEFAKTVMEMRTAELNLVKHSSRKTIRSQCGVAQIGRIHIRRFPQQSSGAIKSDANELCGT